MFYLYVHGVPRILEPTYKLATAVVCVVTNSFAGSSLFPAVACCCGGFCVRLGTNITQSITNEAKIAKLDLYHHQILICLRNMKVYVNVIKYLILTLLVLLEKCVSKWHIHWNVSHKQMKHM
jgi:hypothetical protein